MSTKSSFEAHDFIEVGKVLIEQVAHEQPREFDLLLIFQYALGADVDKDDVVFNALQRVSLYLFRSHVPVFATRTVTRFELIVCAAWCRCLLKKWQTVTALQLAAYSGRTYDCVIRRLRSGALKGAPDAIDPVSARMWLTELKKRV